MQTTTPFSIDFDSPLHGCKSVHSMLRTVDGRDFYIDLVFYHYVLKCFVLVASPIGIVLCADKIDALVRYTLPEENKQIFASKYMLYLPTEEQLKNEIKEVL